MSIRAAMIAQRLRGFRRPPPWAGHRVDEKVQVAGEALRLLPVQRMPGFGVFDEARAADLRQQRLLFGGRAERVVPAPDDERRHGDLGRRGGEARRP
ncbi:MAG: hypothetical protein U1F67_01755 [Rubrivivax sp.]